ncbi:hypothetical protein SteCoe_2725 [Stentor coeruleus]|uniref:Alpha N-terminal protein methyltransferase 1 n=1 Tax=Stentor coeruleus TaxID=5963 RepID=A0A1R2CZ01_9CILI|nr:hypothetical protein SteCoe_2725 [Stentor coeruleus]
MFRLRNTIGILFRGYFKKIETKTFLTRDEAQGEDNLGFSYNSLEEMWAVELSSPQIRGKENWYSLGNSYWSSLEPTIANVLGGSDDIHEPDIRESSAFLEEVCGKYNVPRHIALDCGAGIGRVTKFLLLNQFDAVDLLEQCTKFIDFAKVFVSSNKIRNYFNTGAQNFESEEKYDVIWVQWVLSQLTDDDLFNFLTKIKGNLSPQGMIFFKENTKRKGFIVHKDDFSVTRCEKVLKHAFNKAGLKVLEEQLQKDWPNDLLDVKMFACIPAERINS